MVKGFGMSSLNFQHALLYMTPRSPFARRVRLAFLEHQIAFEEKSVDVFHPEPELLALNPLGRIPIVKLKSGQILIDSTQILSFFYESHPTTFVPKSLEDRIVVSHWTSVALGLSEKIVEYYLEALRPEQSRVVELLSEVDRVVESVLSQFNAYIAHRPQILTSGQLTQADLDMGTALAYLNFRYSEKWKTRFTRAAIYLENLEKRSSFSNTKPFQS
jgi:glutathione S-transferase